MINYIDKIKIIFFDNNSKGVLRKMLINYIKKYNL